RICVAKTRAGQLELARWLKTTATPEQIRQRQTLIAQLAPLLDLRQSLEVLARATLPPPQKGQAAPAPNDLEPLFSWAESTPALLDQRWLKPVARSMPVLTTAIFAACYLGRFTAWPGLLALGIHLWLLMRTREAREQVVRMLSTSEQTVLKIEPLFALLETNPPEGALRDRFDPILKRGDTRPSLACRSLRRIAGWFELRHNGLVYPFINLYLLWDIQCAVEFDRWRSKNGKLLRDWFSLVGEIEALASFAGFHYDAPNTCFAEISESDVAFAAAGLGHPLLHSSERVSNDVDAILAGHGLLVTGSNMSGKSTFLRAMGLAAVLGLSGGPVCARSLRLSPLTVITSMRISDSLASGVSHFYAELRKLHAVVQATESAIPVFFLLDEILHGTNSRERRIGARWILSQLLERNALGAVSTHDLALCELPGSLADRLRLVHFRENMVNGEMTFDYLLRQGPVTEGNALRLMRGMGLAVPLEGD
ncbi:MAG: MutS family DNA mismatch repair protein, partial [Myxococcales bacterium]